MPRAENDAVVAGYADRAPAAGLSGGGRRARPTGRSTAQAVPTPRAAPGDGLAAG